MENNMSTQQSVQQTKVSIRKGLKVIPNHKEIEYLKKKDKDFKTGEYTITGLYSITRIKLLRNDKNKFSEEVSNLKQILINYGSNAVFTPVISRKAINHETNEIFVKLQKSAGLKRITIIEKDINQSSEDMEKYFNKYISKEGKDNCFFLLDTSMSGAFLLSEKLSKLNSMNVKEIGLHFAGYWKYRDNLIQVLLTDNKPNILFCGIWEKVERTPLPVIISMLGVNKVSCGYKWGGKPKVDKPLNRLDEVRIAYETLNVTETNSLKKSINVESNDELYSYLRAEAYEKNNRIIERLSNLEDRKLIEELRTKNILNFFS